MRALSSLDHRRRRPMPVISSIRRTSETPPPAPAALLSSLRSSLMSKSSLMGRHLRHNPDTTETWERSPAYAALRLGGGIRPPARNDERIRLPASRNQKQ